MVIWTLEIKTLLMTTFILKSKIMEKNFMNKYKILRYHVIRGCGRYYFERKWNLERKVKTISCSFTFYSNK